MDRAIRLADEIGAQDEVERWAGARDEIRAAIEEQGWNEKVGAFTQSFGSTDLDASCLLIATVGFLRPDDPRILATIDAIRRDLTDERGLVMRYRADDGLAGSEGSFLICTFWLAEAAARAGRADLARSAFQRAVEHAERPGPAQRGGCVRYGRAHRKLPPGVQPCGADQRGMGPGRHRERRRGKPLGHLTCHRSLSPRVGDTYSRSDASGDYHLGGDRPGRPTSCFATAQSSPRSRSSSSIGRQPPTHVGRRRQIRVHVSDTNRESRPLPGVMLTRHSRPPGARTRRASASQLLCFVAGHEIEDIGRAKPVGRPVADRQRGLAIGLLRGRAIRPRLQPRRGEIDHPPAEVEAPVARGRRQAATEQLLGESPGAAAQLDDGIGASPVAVLGAGRLVAGSS